MIGPTCSFGIQITKILRFCIVYPSSNSFDVTHSYSLPLGDVCIDALGDAQVVLTLDFESVCWQIKVDKDDSDKTILPFNMAYISL